MAGAISTLPAVEPRRDPAAQARWRAACKRTRSAMNVTVSGRARVEDRVGADPSPDHVACTRALLSAVPPSSSPIRSPGHLVHPGSALNPFDPQPWPELTCVSVRNELGDHDLSESLLLHSGQSGVIPAEPGRRRERWHRPSSPVQVGEHRLGVRVDLGLPGRDRRCGLPPALLPLLSPEPALIRWHGRHAAQHHATGFGHGEFHFITLGYVQRCTHLRRQRHLPFMTQPRPRTGHHRQHLPRLTVLSSYPRRSYFPTL